MWKTSRFGVSSLSGAYKKLFIEAALNEATWINNIEAFDGKTPEAGRSYERLSDREKTCAIASVLDSLTNERPAPDLVQWSESTVGAIFDGLGAAIGCEIEIEATGQAAENGSHYFWRKLTLDAAKEALPEEALYCIINGDEDEQIEVDCKDEDSWRCLVECLADMILWDRDFEQSFADSFLRRSAGAATVAGQMLGVRCQYFTTPIPAATDDRLRRAERFLDSLALASIAQQEAEA